MSERFTEHLRTRIDRYGPLCVGIDPSSALLARCGLPDTAAGALDLARRVLDAAAGEVAVVKPQAAYFERFGAAGLQAIEQLLALARAQDTPVIYDAKRGDIDATATAYGEAFFRSEAPLRCDALTVHAYLGYGALAGLVKLAAEAAGGVFVVVRSSNPQGQALQLARLGDGRTVAECLADDISADNAHWLTGGSGCGPVGAVVGATCDDAAAIVDRLPHSYILAPGVGAQGATCADIARRMPNARGRVLANVSRGIFAGGTQPEQLRQTLQQLRDEASVLV